MARQHTMLGFEYEHDQGLPDHSPLSLRERQRFVDKIKMLEDQIQSLEQMADTDPLVSVYNRRVFIREIKRAQTVQARYDIPSSILFFDLNRFKQVNDYYGHGVGDELLIKIGNALKAAVRDCDVVARIGGDEFGVLMFKTDETIAQAKAIILSRQISRQMVTVPEGNVYLTAAWGVSTCFPEDTPKQILDRADRAMYRHKQQSGET